MFLPLPLPLLLPLPLPLLFLLAFPQGICFCFCPCPCSCPCSCLCFCLCSCFSCCHSRRESAFAVIPAIPHHTRECRRSRLRIRETTHPPMLFPHSVLRRPHWRPTGAQPPPVARPPTRSRSMPWHAMLLFWSVNAACFFASPHTRAGIRFFFAERNSSLGRSSGSHRNQAQNGL